MRTLTVSERRLGAMLLALIFIIANLFAVRLLMKRQRAWQRDIIRLRAEQTEASAWLAEKDFWLQRKSWLDEKLPRPAADGQEPARLLEFLQQSAARNTLTVTQQKLHEPRTLENYHEVAAQLEVRGGMESLCRWLAELQAPDKFQAITRLTVQNDAEAAKLVCSLVITRWFVIDVNAGLKSGE
jgi:hypothetical protein